MPRPRGRPPLRRRVFSLGNIEIPAEVTVDTSFVVEALIPSQPQHQECAAFLLALADAGSLLVFNRLLELELAETAFRIALKERWGRNWSRRRLDGRARARAARLAQETRTAWAGIQDSFLTLSLEPVEVQHLVPDLMARYGLMSYDAVHAASAIYSGTNEIITRDSDFARVPARDLTIYTTSTLVPACRRIRAGTA